MSIYALKPRFQELLRPLALRLAASGVTANQVTVTACGISVAIGAALISAPHPDGLFLLLPAWMLLRMAFNAIDGMLAREFGQKSALGAYLNELADVVSDAALYLPFAFVAGAGLWPVVAVIVLSVISEMAGTVAVMAGASRRYDGPMGKSDRAFVFGLAGLLVGAGVPAGAWLDWVWTITALLVVATIVNRVRKGLAEVRNA